MDINQIVQAINTTPLDERVKTDAFNALEPFEAQINHLLAQSSCMASNQDLPAMVTHYAMCIVVPVLQSSGVLEKIQDRVGMGIYTALGGMAYEGVEGTKFL